MNKYLTRITGSDIEAIQAFRVAREAIKELDNTKFSAQFKVLCAIAEDVADTDTFLTAKDIEALSDGVIEHKEVFALIRVMEEQVLGTYKVKCSSKVIPNYYCRCTANGTPIPGTRIMTKDSLVNTYGFSRR